jgi:hypothetical protein
MTKIVTVAVLAGAALALSACGAQKEEAPAEPAETEMMAPEGEATDAEAAAEGLDPTGNPIGPAPADAAPATGNPIGPAGSAEEAAPAAE